MNKTCQKHILKDIKEALSKHICIPYLQKEKHKIINR